MRMQVLPLLAVLSALVGCARPAPVASASPIGRCFDLQFVDWEGALSRTTGLRGLPPTLALDSTAAGAAGLRVRLSQAWRNAGPIPEWITWRPLERGIVLRFQGHTGAVEVLLQRAGQGYSGESVIAEPVMRNVRFELYPAACAGIGGGAV
jgi:hypothetical protein